ncbi:hypothetical protein [Ectothiorhodospira lacustris]|uniref:hypothetical protein n=1 Tax=Ectothiorhodospira lacustris TaxID=2899127 RepID=UPI001EE8EB11|nr:hypothetical protein [Ectothiorhodospira lacustris]
MPHDGVTQSAAFQDSRFCATCHQFPNDGPRTAGKLREDTWRQWRASEFAQRGEHCQSCHMPDRKHQWHGVHSAELIRQALAVDLRIDNGVVTAIMTNVGAGHYLPTYMVAKITAGLRLAMADGSIVDLAEDIIGWHVDVTLEHEYFDTRIPPGSSRQLSAPLPLVPAEGARVELRIHVAPREHYERTYLSVLRQAEHLDPETLRLLKQAYREAVKTHFEAFTVSISVPPLPAQEQRP